MIYSRLRDAHNPLWHSEFFYLPTVHASHLDLGSNTGATLRGLDPSHITCIEAYEPAAEALKQQSFREVICADALTALNHLIQTDNPKYHVITAFDFIEHLPRSDGEKLLDIIETMSTHQVILFIPLETDDIINSDKYKQYMSSLMSTIPESQRDLQTHKSRWTQDDFIDRNYATIVIPNFHYPGFHAMFAVKCHNKSDYGTLYSQIETLSQILDFKSFGQGTRIVTPIERLTANKYMTIGDNVYIGAYSRLEAVPNYQGYNYTPNLYIGNNTSIEPFSHIGCAGNLIIGNDVMIASRVTIMDHSHGYRDPDTAPRYQPLSVAPTIIDDGAWIGENAFIGKSTYIGRHAVVDANERVVNTNIPPYSVYRNNNVDRYYDFFLNEWVDARQDAYQPTISIIIPVHNQITLTDQCLKSITEHTPQPVNIIIIDNGSTEDIASLPYEFSYIRNNTNTGWVHAINQGLCQTKDSDLVILLNNDTEVTPGWLTYIIDIFRHLPNVGLVGPLSNAPNNPYQYGAPAENPITRRYISHAVPKLTGFCLALSRPLIDTIGGLDPIFGIGNFDDDDYIARAILSGYECRVALASYVTHHSHRTFTDTHTDADFNNLLQANWATFKAKWGIDPDLPYGSSYALPSSSYTRSLYIDPCKE
jgi:GT2 family glycosyltransferase